MWWAQEVVGTADERGGRMGGEGRSLLEALAWRCWNVSHVLSLDYFSNRSKV